MMYRSLGLALSLALLSACSGAPGSPSMAPQAQTNAAGHSLGSNDGASALPGDGASALPGAQLSCPPSTSAGTMSCTVAINVTIAPLSPGTPAAQLPGLHPADLQAAYGLGSGAAATVAIVDAYDDPAAESDLAVYRETYGLSPCTSSNGCFQKRDERGGTALPQANAAWAQEISLDLDMVSAACPQCKILLIEADSASIDDLGIGVDTAVARGAAAVSNSYYAAEWNGETTEDAHFNHAGVAIVASSGDQGWVSYPAASPYVVSVGGTSLSRSTAGWTESAWQYAGHGCSTYERKPSWQKGASCASRSAVDVSAVADPSTGVSMFDTAAGGWLVAGGTSVGAPLVASAYALASNGASDPFTYAHAIALHQLGGGYQSITGLGTPNGLGAF